MKNVMVVNFQPPGKMYSLAMLEAYTKAQIENSLELGWSPEDILLLTNFAFEFMDVRARQLTLRDRCLTGSKTFAMYQILREDLDDEEYWVHDLDAWQNLWFDCPSFKDVGICEHGGDHPLKFSGSSVFYRRTARDIVAALAFLLDHKNIREEPALHVILAAPGYRDRVTTLNNTFNVGCPCFSSRYETSETPIRVCHFRPDCPTGTRRHLLGENDLNVKTAAARLERVIRKYFDIPALLSGQWRPLVVGHHGTVPG